MKNIYDFLSSTAVVHIPSIYLIFCDIDTSIKLCIIAMITLGSIITTRHDIKECFKNNKELKDLKNQLNKLNS